MISGKNIIDFTKLVSDFSGDIGDFKVTYEYIDTGINPQLEYMRTSSYTATAAVSIENTVNKEFGRFHFDLMEVPVATSMGTKIDNTFYEICASNGRAPGWYHDLSKEGHELNLIALRGRKISFIERRGIVSVKLGSKSSPIALGVFLKALSGLSYKEIIKKIGIRNPFIIKSFADEPSYKDCVDGVLSVIIPKVANKFSYLDIPDELRPKELKNRFSSRFIFLGNTAYNRFNKTTSFTSRCLDCILAQGVLNYPRGTKLTRDVLKELDESDLDTILVQKDSEVYEIKKYPINEGEVLSINELCTELNIMFNNIKGFNYLNDTFDDLNREIISAEEAIKNEVSNRLMDMNEFLSAYLISPNIELTSIPLDNLNNYKIDDYISRCKLEFKHAQLAETVNGLSLLNKKYKVNTDYSGTTTEDIISIKPYQYGMYDLLQIPENNKVGLVQHRSMATDINENKQIVAPFYKVVDGKIDLSSVHYLTADDKQNKFIAPFDCDLDQEYVRCLFNERVMYSSSKNIEYIHCSVFNTGALANLSIPFAQHSDGKRVVMGCSQNKQSVPCIKSEAPLVSTGAVAFERTIDEIVIRARSIAERAFYDNTDDIPGDVSVYDFMELPVKLASIEDAISGYRNYRFKIELGDLTFITVIPLPFGKRSDSEGMSHYYLNHSQTLIYQGDDIVLYNNSFEINHRPLIKHVNIGPAGLDESQLPKFDFDTALGNNFLFCYKSGGIESMDDSMIISSEVLGSNMLNNCKIVEYRRELKRPNSDFKEVFESPRETAYHSKDGLPKQGTFIQPKGTVFWKKITKSNGESHHVPLKLEMDREGYVLFANIVGNEAIACIATYSEIEVGDKLAGDHGNKGVIGKILPRKDMPYLPDGRVVQVMLNPLGVPSRMNFAQFAVAMIGLKMANTGQRMIISPYNPDSYKIIKEYIKDETLQPMQLYDGVTGLPFDRTTSVGVIYLKKQVHNVKSKFNVCAVPTSYHPITGQPNKGKSISGAQSLGEMESWALVSLGCMSSLQEFLSVKSDDVTNRKSMETAIYNSGTYAGPTKNNSLSTHEAIHMILGTHMRVDKKDSQGRVSYVYEPLTDKVIKRLSPKPCKNTKESLHDVTIFGSTLGSENLARSKNRWGWIDLKCSIIHPNNIYKSELLKTIPVTEVRREFVDKLDKYTGVITKVEKILDSTKFMGKTLVNNLISEKVYFDFTDLPNIRYSLDKDLLVNPITGYEGLLEVFRKFKLEWSRKILQDAVTRISESSQLTPEKKNELFNLNGRLLIVKDLIERGFEYKDFILTSFPVLPASYRFSTDSRSADFDMFYMRIMSAAESRKSVEVYNRILEFIGLDNTKKLSKERKAKNILEFFGGKNSDRHHGHLRDSVAAKRIMFSGRSAIVPGDIPLGYVGLPRSMCYVLLSMEIRRELINKYAFFSGEEEFLESFVVAMESGNSGRAINVLMSKLDDDLNPIISRKQSLEVIQSCDDIVNELLAKSAVYIGRQPTLRPESVRGLVPTMVEGFAIRIHVLLCSAFNADFDGDQMWVAMVHSKESKIEALTKAHPSRGVFSPKDGSVNFLPAQDILLGIYLATMLHENVMDVTKLPERYGIDKVRYYSDLELMKFDIYMGVIDVKDLACYTHSNGKRYISTAGRILFNSIFIGGLTEEPFTNGLQIPFIDPNNYCALKYDGLVKNNLDNLLYNKKDRYYIKDGKERTKEPNVHYFERDGETYEYSVFSIKKILNKEARLFNTDDITSKLFDLLVSFGIYHTVRSGITLWLGDFKDSDEVKHYADKYNELQVEWNKLYDLGFMSAEGLDELSIRAANYITDKAKKDIMKQYSRNDNVYIIIDSGARGSIAQVMKSTGLVGIVSKTNKEQMPVPVLTGYKYGLDAIDSYIIANSTRNGVATTQKDVTKTGELTRDLVYMTSGLNVTAHDCGCGFVDIEVDYDEPSDKNPSLENKAISKDSELYKEIVNLTRNGAVNSKVLSYIHKHHITNIPLSDGTTAIFKYKLSPLFRNLMTNKLATGLPGLYNNSVITGETLDAIEENQLKVIKSRTLFTCQQHDGVCAKCYGIRHEDRKLPEPVYYASFIAAQSIGEPSTQFVLGVINLGGAGNSKAGALDICKAILNGSLSSDSFVTANMATLPGYVSVNETGNNAMVVLGGKSYNVPKATLNVNDGEYVKPGDILTNGIIRVQDLPSGEGNEKDTKWVFNRMFTQLKTLYNMYHGNNLSVDARHFEVIVKSQLSYVHIFSSEDPNLPAGTIQKLQDVLNSDKLDTIKYFNRPLTRSERVANVSGTFTTIFHHDIAKASGRIALNSKLLVETNSPLASISIGADIKSGKRHVSEMNIINDYSGENTEVDDISKYIPTTNDLVVIPREQHPEVASTSIYGDSETPNILDMFKDFLPPVDELVAKEDVSEKVSGEVKSVPSAEQVKSTSVFGGPSNSNSNLSPSFNLDDFVEEEEEVQEEEEDFSFESEMTVEDYSNTSQSDEVVDDKISSIASNISNSITTTGLFSVDEEEEEEEEEDLFNTSLVPNDLYDEEEEEEEEDLFD